ncbi:hypothetical protein NW752_012091 [Fusarium irregulare]|uniref:Uncharacterized protein n=1 Tax=Fusarium irregulare TaxID=2494466 RepID=A0A9W8U622_9HYPO|nr:hypothetical protein NW752_012091 [Fusarium irregulare]KAJ4006569.1 hypothetical protein NW766_010664 [Fusarium irregulare]
MRPEVLGSSGQNLCSGQTAEAHQHSGINIREDKYHQTTLSNHCDPDWESPEILDAGELEERYEHAENILWNIWGIPGNENFLFKRYCVAATMVADISAFEDSALLSLTQDARQLVEGQESMSDWVLRGEYRR